MSGLKSRAAHVRSSTPINCPSASVTGLAAHAILPRASAKCSGPATTDGRASKTAVPTALVPIWSSSYSEPGANSILSSKRSTERSPDLRLMM